MEAVNAEPSPQTNAPAPWLIWRSKLKAAAENVLAEQADFLCLFDRGAESEYRKGVFGTDIDITFGCAAGNCCDHHTFEHTVRVAFHDAPVH